MTRCRQVGGTLAENLLANNDITVVDTNEFRDFTG